MVEEERGDFAAAARAEALATDGLYTVEYRTCSDAQRAYVVEKVSAYEGPVVDLASGRGYLVERLAGVPGVHPLDTSRVPGCTYTRPQIASVGRPL